MSAANNVINIASFAMERPQLVLFIVVLYVADNYRIMTWIFQ